MKCLMNGMPVSEYGSPCGGCSLYLHTCQPIIVNGYLCGAECDLYACEWCNRYEECTTPGMTLACHSEQESMKGVIDCEAIEL